MNENQKELIPQEGLTLTLEPQIEEAVPPAKVITPVVLDESGLSDNERQMVAEFSKQIDITNSNIILQYGSSAQKKISDFSESALSNVRTKDMGEIGSMITNLVGELKNFSDDDKKSFLDIFRKPGNQIANLKTKYDKAEVNINKICTVLEDHQIQLMKDIVMLDAMYEKNLVYFKELTMYILAGKRKLNEERETTLKELIAKAEASGLPEDAQAARDFASLCDRFEKKIFDLELTRQISIQMAPQIRLVQGNDTLMAEKIQSSLVNTIPLWKSQMVLALGIAHSQEAIEAQRAVTNMTNELLRKNADTLKTGTLEAAKESERAIVDIETLQYTNRTLIETLNEVIAIQDEGRQKRRSAEAELGRIEGELRQKLLEIRNETRASQEGEQN